MSQPLSIGLHSLPASAYHADPCPQPSLSSGLVRTLLSQSPLHAWTACPRLNPWYESKDSKVFDFGRAAHRTVLGAGDDYEAVPSDILASNGAASTKEAKAFIEECRARGVTPLKEEEVERVHAVARAVEDKLHLLGISMRWGDSEITAIAEIDGVWCRAMFDNLPDDPDAPVYDFKTTVDAAPAAIERAVLNYGYDVQAAWYLDVLKAATGQERRFRFIFTEKEDPFETTVVEMTPAVLEMARRKTARAREIWRGCLQADSWPGYPAGVHMIDLPAWHYERWLERESAEEEYRQRHGRDIYDIARRWQAPAPMEAAQ